MHAIVFRILCTGRKTGRCFTVLHNCAHVPSLKHVWPACMQLMHINACADDWAKAARRMTAPVLPVTLCDGNASYCSPGRLAAQMECIRRGVLKRLHAIEGPPTIYACDDEHPVHSPPCTAGIGVHGTGGAGPCMGANPCSHNRSPRAPMVPYAEQFADADDPNEDLLLFKFDRDDGVCQSYTHCAQPSSLPPADVEREGGLTRLSAADIDWSEEVPPEATLGIPWPLADVRSMHLADAYDEPLPDAQAGASPAADHDAPRLAGYAHESLPLQFGSDLKDPAALLTVAQHRPPEDSTLPSVCAPHVNIAESYAPQQSLSAADMSHVHANDSEACMDAWPWGVQAGFSTPARYSHPSRMSSLQLFGAPQRTLAYMYP